MTDELAQEEVRLRVHAGPETNMRVRGKVFARQLSALIKALESADKTVNGGVRHDYVITGLEQKSAQASLRQIVSSKKPRQESPLALLPSIVNAVLTSEPATIIKFSEAVASLRQMAKGAGESYSHADLQVGKSPSFRIDEYFEKRLADALRSMPIDDATYYAGAAYGSFDGVIKEVDLRGDTPRLKLILSAGSIEIDCVTRGISIDEIRASLNVRAWVEGKALYGGSSGLPERIEIISIKTVSPKPNLSRWSGAFTEIDDSDWGDAK